MQQIHLKSIQSINIFNFSVLIYSMVSIDSYNITYMRKTSLEVLSNISEYEGVLRTESLRTPVLETNYLSL